MKRRLVSILLALCMVLVIPQVRAEAATPVFGTLEENENITWYLQSDGTLLLTGTGKTPTFGGYYWADPAPWEPYADEITSIRIEEGITGINPGAFENCTSAKGISIPASLESFATDAWPYGDNFMFVTSGTGSTNYIAYEGVLYANSPAGGVWELGGKGPTLVKYPQGLKYAETSYYTVREGTQAIAPYAFRANPYVTSVILPSSIREIGYDAFAYCTSLEKVQLPEGIREIGECAFEGCKSLKEIILPSSLTTLDASAFWYCDALDTVVVPASVTSFSANWDIDSGIIDLQSHKDFYFRGNAPTFSIPGNASMASDGPRYIRTDIYYPKTASGWEPVIEEYSSEFMRFIPYDLDGSTQPSQPTQPVPSTPTQEDEIYTVAAGDTLSSIAARYGISYLRLTKYNGISNPNLITVGQKIKIPKVDKTVEALAKEVINGLWGSGAESKRRLEAEGYDFSAIQSVVNELLS